MPNQKYTDDPHLIVLTGAEAFPIDTGSADYYTTPADVKTYVFNAYAGQTSIQNVGTIGTGTWAGDFQPRITSIVSTATIIPNPATTDIYTVTALAVSTVINPSVVGANPGRKLEIRIKDNGSAQSITYGANIRFNGVAPLLTTTISRTVFIVMEFNFIDNIWDVHYCTDTMGGGGSPALTSAYVGYGVAGVLGGTSDLTYASNVLLINAVSPMVNLKATASGGILSYKIQNVGGSVLNQVSANYNTGQCIVGTQLAGYYLDLWSENASVLTFETTTRNTLIKNKLFVGGSTSPTALIHVPAGTATAGTAPLKLTTGTALTTPEDGAIEYHTSHLYFTIGSTRYQLDQQSSSLPSYVSKTSTYTALTTDGTIDCTSGTFTVTLPTAVGVTGKIYYVKNSGAGVITIATTSSQTIDGSTTATMPVQYQSLTLQSNGANWIIL